MAESAVQPAGYGTACGPGDACNVYGEPVSGAGYGGGGAGFGAGAGWDQCGPHYYDIAVDFLYWKRENVSQPGYVVTRDDSGANNGQPVLNTWSVSADGEPGFRATARLDIAAVSFVEATYFGTFEWQSSAQATGNGNLYSFFTDFGQITTVAPVDAADLQRIEFQSELHNSEINYRTYWVGMHPAVSGTWLMGARWVHMTDDFTFQSRVNGPPQQFLDYEARATNDLVGFQIGGDAQVGLRQGFRMVAEGKAGIYNNRVKNQVRIAATGINPTSQGLIKGNQVAFVGEGRIGFVADILPSLSLRAGYEVLWLNSIATGATVMLANSDPTVVFSGSNQNLPLNLVRQSQALYQGLYAGAEYVW
jgi:hypothetical protein